MPGLIRHPESHLAGITLDPDQVRDDDIANHVMLTILQGPLDQDSLHVGRAVGRVEQAVDQFQGLLFF